MKVLFSHRYPPDGAAASYRMLRLRARDVCSQLLWFSAVVLTATHSCPWAPGLRSTWTVRRRRGLWRKRTNMSYHGTLKLVSTFEQNYGALRLYTCRR